MMNTWGNGMNTEIKITLKDIDNFKFIHMDDFESDFKQCVDHLFVIQGIEYKDIDFDFKYQVSRDDLKGEFVT